MPPLYVPVTVRVYVPGAVPGVGLPPLLPFPFPLPLPPAQPAISVAAPITTSSQSAVRSSLRRVANNNIDEMRARAGATAEINCRKPRVRNGEDGRLLDDTDVTICA